VSWEMRTEDGNPMWPASQDVESIDYAGYAELLGFQGLRITDDDQIDDALDRAFAHPGVTVIDAVVSRNVPPLPPHITKEYALNMAKSLLTGDPHEGGVIVDGRRRSRRSRSSGCGAPSTSGTTTIRE